MSSIKTDDNIEVITNEEVVSYESLDDSFKKANLLIESKYKAQSVLSKQMS